MKAKILNSEGKEGKEIELPKCFSSKIREDIAQKYFEIIKKQQPYAPYFLAGKLYSASGKIKHGRRLWKTAYGKGISRVPRKILWRRGTQFYWIGATVSGTRGGRKAHPPKIEHFLKQKRINKKEVKLAMLSAITATCLLNYLKKRYESLQDRELKLKFPIIVESDILKLKTKNFFEAIKKILNGVYDLAVQKKMKRAGKGKARGRKYRKNKGLLFVIGKDENFKIKSIDVRKLNELGINDLYPLGRLTLYTENAVLDLKEIFNKEDKK